MLTLIPTILLALAVAGGVSNHAPEASPPVSATAQRARQTLPDLRILNDKGVREDRGWTMFDLAYAPLARGDAGEAVLRLQRHLTEMGVYRGPMDGEFGVEAEASVIAAHKLLGIERTKTWQASDWVSTRDISHSNILARHASEPDRVEVNLQDQLLYVIRDSVVAAIVPVSSGNGASYWSKNGGSNGGYVRATTPQGDFTLYKHIPRWRYNYMGGLYKPWYFTLYYAVHGSRSVPTVPASHGCVRIPTWEANHLDAFLKIGLPIHIWDE